MQLIMIRHGRPEWRRPLFSSLYQFERMSADYDSTHLSKKGIEDLENLPKQLPKALILSSDLPRARETAEIIGHEDRPIKSSALFRELKAPRIATDLLGKLWAPSIIWSLVHWFCWISGIGEFPEKPSAAWSRAANATDKLLKYFEMEQTIILVSHGWFMILLTIYLRWHGLIERGSLIPSTGYGTPTKYTLQAK